MTANPVAPISTNISGLLVDRLEAAEYTAYPWTIHEAGLYPDTPETPLSEYQSDPGPSLSVISTDEEHIVAVLGVGYVGNHLVASFSKQYNVIGFDVSHARVRDLQTEHHGNTRLQFTNSAKDLCQATHYLISVPTLLRPDKSIDSSYLRSAIQTVGQVARRGSTVIVESSVAVGMTRHLLGPVAQAGGFFAGMSPERVDPGRTDPPLSSIPKIVSGLDDLIPGSLDAISRIYRTVFDVVVPVSSPEVAEMMKLYENCQRMMCIAYANEMADACISHGIDPYEVCGAAATKPFGYMPYIPGIGVGGHCIPVNPFYLLSNSKFPLLETATKAMWERPGRIAERTLASLRHQPAKGITPRILVVGMAFKAGQSSLSNSPGLNLAKSLFISGEVDVVWADALVKQIDIPQISRLQAEEWRKDMLETFDLIIVALRQRDMDFGLLKTLEGVVVEKWC